MQYIIGEIADFSVEIRYLCPVSAVLSGTAYQKKTKYGSADGSSDGPARVGARRDVITRLFHSGGDRDGDGVVVQHRRQNFYRAGRGPVGDFGAGVDFPADDARDGDRYAGRRWRVGSDIHRAGNE